MRSQSLISNDANILIDTNYTNAFIRIISMHSYISIAL